MKICQENNVTAIMVTHDVDEALLLSDRVVMLTNGPEAHIGQILDVQIPRPRKRMEVVNHPSYYSLRNEVISFLDQQKRAKRRKKAAAPAVAAGVSATSVAASRWGTEKAQVELGFVPLTDCAPLVVAQEKGFFQAEGITVTLSKQGSWRAIAEGLTGGQLQAAQMVAGMPLAMTMGLGMVSGAVPIITPLVLSRNGNAITIDRSLYEQAKVRSLADLRTYLDRNRDQPHVLGAVHPASMQNLMLRYWLAAGGIDPDRDTEILMLPPVQMVTQLRAKHIDGYCAGEPWNTRAVQDELGVVIATDLDIWNGHPEKVLGLREDWVQANPQTTQALMRALMRACEYCDDHRNRAEVVELLSKPEYLGENAVYCRPGLVESYDFGTEAPPQSLWRFNQFHVDQANYPNAREGMWILTQFARWGMAPFPKNRIEVLERVYRADLFNEASRVLGWPTIEPSRSPFALFDGVMFNPDDPLGYLRSLEISREIRIEEIQLDQVESQVAAS